MSFHIDALGGAIDGSYDEKRQGARGRRQSRRRRPQASRRACADSSACPSRAGSSGTIKLTLPEGKASKGTGTVNLEGRATSPSATARRSSRDALDCRSSPSARSRFNAEAKDGILKVTKFAAGGKDLELTGDGKVQMRELATESTLDVNLKFKINDGYRGKSEITKSALRRAGLDQGRRRRALRPGDEARARAPTASTPSTSAASSASLTFEPQRAGGRPEPRRRARRTRAATRGRSP